MKYGNFAVTFGLTEEMKNIVLNVVKNKNMNKLLITITISILLSGCNYYISEGQIVNIEDYNQDNICIYEVSNKVWFMPSYKFIMDCKKLNVGDTIKIVKL
jgi:hypothetical protein